VNNPKPKILTIHQGIGIAQFQNKKNDWNLRKRIEVYCRAIMMFLGKKLGKLEKTVGEFKDTEG